MKEEPLYDIRRAPNACCPDCNIHNGYCYEMHKTLLEKNRMRLWEELRRKLGLYDGRDRKVIDKIIDEVFEENGGRK